MMPSNASPGFAVLLRTRPPTTDKPAKDTGSSASRASRNREDFFMRLLRGNREYDGRVIKVGDDFFGEAGELELQVNAAAVPRAGKNLGVNAGQFRVGAATGNRAGPAAVGSAPNKKADA